MATVTSVTTTGEREATVTITGTGFGASQGSNVVLFYPDEDGDIVTLNVTSWANTSLVVAVPTGAQIGANAYFTVLIGTVGTRSPTFLVKPLARTATPASLTPGSLILVPPYLLVDPV